MVACSDNSDALLDTLDPADCNLLGQNLVGARCNTIAQCGLLFLQYFANACLTGIRTLGAWARLTSTLIGTSVAMLKQLGKILACQGSGGGVINLQYKLSFITHECSLLLGHENECLSW